MTRLITLGSKQPGRVDRGVEVDATIAALLAKDSPVAIGVSGGKDSCAAALATIEHLDAIGHTGERVLIHADLGRVEWADSLPTCERLASHLGLELIVVRRAAGDMMDRWLKRWSNNVQRYVDLSCVKVILPWSTPRMRFCTSELKSAPMAAALVKRFPGQRIVSACGVRREESDDRSHAPTSKANNRLTNKTRKTSGVDWNPIAAWTEADVFAFCAARGFTMHEGYTLYGMSRISCMFCIMANSKDLVASAKNPAHVDTFREMVALEVRSTFAFQGSRWLGDVAPHLLTPALAIDLAAAKVKATAREVVEARIPKHLLYVKGWPTVMPTADEAVMLSEVRTEIARLLDLDVQCTTPATIIDRYASLMAENARRNA